jgi:hypothetical protein
MQKEKTISNLINKAKGFVSKSIQEKGGQLAVIHEKLTGYSRDEVGGQWVVHAFINPSGELGQLFWMNPSQVSIARLFGEVMQLDASENRNAYKMSLITFIVVNGENRPRNIAYCLSETQDADAFEWMFRILKVAAEGPPDKPAVHMPLKVVFTDRDKAMALAISRVWPRVFHRHCIWHLSVKISERILDQC